MSELKYLCRKLCTTLASLRKVRSAMSSTLSNLGRVHLAELEGRNSAIGAILEAQRECSPSSFMTQAET